MVLFRRFLVFQAFLLWQGGFLFYAAVVVPIGTEVLGSATHQGAISQQVAVGLNLAGAVWAALVLVDLLADHRAGQPIRTRLILWMLMVLGLVALALLHPRLGAAFDADAISVTDRRAFRPLHLAYLWISTLHWFLGLALAWLTLAAWTRPVFGENS